MSNAVNCATDTTANPWLTDVPLTKNQVDESAALCAVGAIFDQVVEGKNAEPTGGSDKMDAIALLAGASPAEGDEKDYLTFKDICSSLAPIWAEAFSEAPGGDNELDLPMPVNAWESTTKAEGQHRGTDPVAMRR
jgi:hypothetical protein